MNRFTNCICILLFAVSCSILGDKLAEKYGLDIPKTQPDVSPEFLTDFAKGHKSFIDKRKDVQRIYEKLDKILADGDVSKNKMKIKVNLKTLEEQKEELYRAAKRYLGDAESPKHWEQRINELNKQMKQATSEDELKSLKGKRDRYKAKMDEAEGKQNVIYYYLFFDEDARIAEVINQLESDGKSKKAEMKEEKKESKSDKKAPKENKEDKKDKKDKKDGKDTKKDGKGNKGKNKKGK